MHFNQLTPAEAERLALLAEECGEVIQAIGKVLRHGFEGMPPDGGPTNRQALERECGDAYHAIWRLIGAGDIDGNGMSQRADDKAKSIVRYLHHQGHNVEAQGQQTEDVAMNLLREVYGRLWCEAYYDPFAEQTRDFARPLADLMGKANEILRFKA